MPGTREAQAARVEREKGFARECRSCGATHREQNAKGEPLECPPADMWLVAGTFYRWPYPERTLRQLMRKGRQF